MPCVLRDARCTAAHGHEPRVIGSPDRISFASQTAAGVRRAPDDVPPVICAARYMRRPLCAPHVVRLCIRALTVVQPCGGLKPAHLEHALHQRRGDAGVAEDHEHEEGGEREAVDDARVL